MNIYERCQLVMAAESTFSFQPELPNLPLPKLEETIDKYLKSLLPVVCEKQINELAGIARKFVTSENGRKLQSFLEKKSACSRNWIEKWWYDAYTTNRDSLLTQNMGAIIPKTFMAQQNSQANDYQLHVASQMIFHMMQYWKLVREEKIEIMKSRGVKWDMSQVYNLFNAVREPAIPKDKISRYFQTENEGVCPSHVIILCNGYIWKLDTMKNNLVKTVEEFYSDLSYIKKNSAFGAQNSIIPLTTLNRDSWAEIRSAIMDNSDINQASFKSIETAVFSLTLSENHVENESQLMKYALFGSAVNNYCDKNLNIVVLRDGKSCLQAEHGNVDAISLFAPCDYAAGEIAENLENNKTKQECLNNTTSHLLPNEIEFEISGCLADKIRIAEQQLFSMGANCHVNVYHYENFGAEYCKKLKFYADTVIQIALQMAFVKTHKKLTPTYETASTRQFYHGRTETVRSLTIELSNFINALENGASIDVVRTSFFEAYNAHNNLMDAAKAGRGIDRHFLGLRKAMDCLTTYGDNVENPLFSHPSYTACGGNGNFKLSTSFLGYHENGCLGYVTPMCKDGYGAFYRINSKRITFTLTNLNDDETNAEEFRENLENSLDYIKNVILIS